MITRPTVLLLISLLTASEAFAPSSRPTAFSGVTLFSSEEPAAEAEKKSEAKKDDGADDILNSPAFLKRKLEVLKEDLTKIDVDIEEAKATFEANKAEMGEKFDRLKLEFQNMQNRSVKQNTGDEKSRVEVARAVVEVIDNFDRAFAAVEPDTDEKKEIEAAYKDSYEHFMKVLEESLGVTPVESIGCEFDYEVHNAVTVMPSEYDEGIICAELQRGYILGDNLIRAAMVAVST